MWDFLGYCSLQLSCTVQKKLKKQSERSCTFYYLSQKNSVRTQTFLDPFFIRFSTSSSVPKPQSATFQNSKMSDTDDKILNECNQDNAEIYIQGTAMVKELGLQNKKIFFRPTDQWHFVTILHTIICICLNEQTIEFAFKEYMAHDT